MELLFFKDLVKLIKTQQDCRVIANTEKNVIITIAIKNGKIVDFTCGELKGVKAVTSSRNQKIVDYQIQDNKILEIPTKPFPFSTKSILQIFSFALPEYVNYNSEEFVINETNLETNETNLETNETNLETNETNLETDKKAQCKKANINYFSSKIFDKKLNLSPLSSTKKHQPSTLINQRFVPEKQEKNAENIVHKKWLWLFLGIPLLLFINNLYWSRNSQLTTNTNLSIQQQKLCIDLTSRQSPRMSLGDKILTQEHHHFQPLSKISLYEGSAAFARCEFSTAKNKFQKSLAVGKNNPEALIYLNNVAAITQEHLKIAVSVPLGSKPEVAWEILRGVAQAQAEINQQGGIRQKLLLVQIVNDDNNPEIVRQVAEQLSADKSILAVVGHNSSNASLAASEIYQKHGLVMISPTSGSTELSSIGSYIFRTVFTVASMANTLSDYASVNSFSKITICFDSSSSASSSFTQEFISEITKDSGKITEVKCDFVWEDLNPKLVVDLAIAQNADALLLAPSLQKISQAIAIRQDKDV